MAHTRLTKEDVHKLAHLARIDISGEEETRFAEDMSAILDYVGAVENAKHEEGVNASLKNVFRPDCVTHEGGRYRDGLLANAPAHTNEYVRVKKILS